MHKHTHLQATTAKECKKAADEGQPAWCCYNNDATYGKLYNWYTLNDPRGLCPAGWHVSSDADWKTFEAYLGGNSIASVKLRSAEWIALGNNKNSCGFSAVPGRTRFNISQFLYLGKNGYWLTSTSIDMSKAICRQISDTDTFVMTKIFKKSRACRFAA